MFCKDRGTNNRVERATLEVVRCASAEKQVVFERQLQRMMRTNKSKRTQRIGAEVSQLASEARKKLQMVSLFCFFATIYSNETIILVSDRVS